MKVLGSSIQQLDKYRADGSPKPKSECRRWRLWATTDEGRRSKRFAGTWTQAQEALRAFVSELEAQVPNSETFGAYAESWRLWREKYGSYSPNTLAGDAVCVNALRRTDLENMRMDAIAPGDCRDALLWLRENPVKGGEMKPTTVAKLHQALSAIMQQAVDDGKLARNPMCSVSRPKPRPTEREALSPDEMQLFLNRLDSMPLDGRAMAVYLMACLGLRCGEACALRDEDVSGGFAHVRSTVRSADDSVGPPKSGAGDRMLPMPPRLAAKVESWRTARDAMGIRSEWLCCKLDGARLSTGSVSGWWRGCKGEGGYMGARDRLGCPGMRLHELRHSNLSMMARHMSVFDLQRYAGWSSIAPARIYVHDDLDAVSHAVEMAWA